MKTFLTGFSPSLMGFFKSLFRNLMVILWPEIYSTNLTLVYTYINKLPLQYIYLLQAAVSKISMMLSKDLLY